MDLRYRTDNFSAYWLNKCIGKHALYLVDAPSFVTLRNGVLDVNPATTPFDACAVFEVRHQPLPSDSLLQSQSLTIKIKKDKNTPAISTCSSLEGKCSPLTEQFPMSCDADEIKRFLLF